MSASPTELAEAGLVGAPRAVPKPFDIEERLATMACLCATAAQRRRPARGQPPTPRLRRRTPTPRRRLPA